MADNGIHRSGPLKQTNKRHKTGRHRSKGAIDNAAKGKVSLNVVSRRHKEQVRREQRRHHLEQVRKNKRQKVFDIKRHLGGQHSAPFLVCILPMHLKIDANSALAILEGCDTEAVVERSASGITYINVPRYKQRFAFVVPPIGRGNEFAVLDCLKVADTTLLLTSALMGEDEVFDKWGHRIFNMISGQGIPTPIVTLMDLASLNPKRRNSAKSAAQKFIAKLLPKEKIVELDTNAAGLNMLRRIGTQKKNTLHNKKNRPHLIGDVVQYVLDKNDAELGVLRVTGFLRGTALDVNGLVHIPGLGDFQMSHIDSTTDPYQQNSITEVQFLVRADPLNQTSLQSENIPDAMDAEQIWPTEEEIEKSQLENKKLKHVKRIPKGWSAYQAAWIPDVETIHQQTNSDEDDEFVDIDADSVEDVELMSCENQSFDDECQVDKDESSESEYVETTSVSDAAALNAEKYDQQIDLQEERETLRKIKESRQDQMWPDEMDTPTDVVARERYQKYRGLESFRTSPWDAKENLPNDYARIYQFRNFNNTKRYVLADAHNNEHGIKV